MNNVHKFSGVINQVCSPLVGVVRVTFIVSSRVNAP